MENPSSGRPPHRSQAAAAPAAGPRKRAGRLASAGVITEAATTLFLRKGYLGTSMDDIAALAGVSKQTVYKHFADKERLFSEIVLGMVDQVGEPFRARTLALRNTDDVEKDLGEFAHWYVSSVIRPPVLQLRRLVIGEATRLPELARAYYERAPGRTLEALAACFQHLAERGLLRVDDPGLAANHFAFLILGLPLDMAMFCETDGELFTVAGLERLADAGVSSFLAAYGRPRA